MSSLSKIAAIAAAAAIAATLAIPASAAQMKAPGPKPGDCKQAYEQMFGASPQMAQLMWQQAVAGKHGNKWAIWAGAKNKSVVPVSVGGAQQFRALARPCFHHPVP